MSEKDEQKKDEQKKDEQKDAASSAAKPAEGPTLSQKDLNEPIESLLHGMGELIEEVGRIASEVHNLALRDDIDEIKYYLSRLQFLKYLKPQSFSEDVPDDELSSVRRPLEAPPAWNKVEEKEPFPNLGQGFEGDFWRRLEELSGGRMGTSDPLIPEPPLV